MKYGRVCFSITGVSRNRTMALEWKKGVPKPEEFRKRIRAMLQHTKASVRTLVQFSIMSRGDFVPMRVQAHVSGDVEDLIEDIRIIYACGSLPKA